MRLNRLIKVNIYGLTGLYNDYTFAEMKKREPIQRRKLSHEVRDRLLDMITKGELKEGDKMPSEHELMERFGVGRPAVREAMQSIESMGLIAIQHGGRAKIKKVTAQDIIGQMDSATRHLLSSSSENVDHLREARQVFEAGVAFLATKRAGTKDIEILEEKLKDMVACKKDRAKFLKADLEFHKAIARISGNPILFSVSAAMLKWLSEVHTDYERDILGIPELVDLTCEEHKKILECIANKDALGATNSISDHILRVNSLYDEYKKI